MGTVCLQAASLAGIICGAIVGGLILASAFVFVLYRTGIFNRKDENKMFYVNRKGSIEMEDTIDGESCKKECPKSPPNDQSMTQKSIELSGHSIYKETSEQSNPTKLYELGITISKSHDNNFKVESVEKTDSQFLPGDTLFHLALDLKQLPLEKAASLLELLAPFKVSVEALRVKQTEISVEAEVEHDPIDETADEIEEQKTMETSDSEHKPEGTDQTEEMDDESKIRQEENPIERRPKQVEEELQKAEETGESELPEVSPPPPASSPPASPISGRSNRDSQASESGRSGSDEESRRQATKIPTPKMSNRSLSRPTINRSPDNTSSGNVNTMYQDMITGCHKSSDVLVVSSEETDEFGLTTTQYNTLENNRRRLERERQQLRDLGILS
ncbi:unnamed protein product [Bursaphelenchus xylophilus]|uniref:(pine wood nematode) hypothetical protein n=1 Tax=Bursaphelenchus xylophilus TaxID=6326 RepID=A0A1I7RS28_BURXY|nr:unnamed protein product [Bursaphelenchus xylophilus]CAG9123283.1 unnamed protein product [Bursaphelenchus xylophilus]